MTALPPPPDLTPEGIAKRKAQTKIFNQQFVGLIALLVIAGLVWAVCSAIMKKPDPNSPPGPGSVALSGTATEQALCAAVDSGASPQRISALVGAVSNDAEAGITLGLDGVQLNIHLSETNNANKVQEDINQMKSDCRRDAG